MAIVELMKQLRPFAQACWLCESSLICPVPFFCLRWENDIFTCASVSFCFMCLEAVLLGAYGFRLVHRVVNETWLSRDFIFTWLSCVNQRGTFLSEGLSGVPLSTLFLLLLAVPGL